jgi:hypothetical protein
MSLLLTFNRVNLIFNEYLNGKQADKSWMECTLLESLKDVQTGKNLCYNVDMSECGKMIRKKSFDLNKIKKEIFNSEYISKLLNRE